MFFFKYTSITIRLYLYSTPMVSTRKALKALSLLKNFVHFLIVSYSLYLLIWIILLRIV